MNWLRNNAPIVEAAAAILTACVALAALIGVKVQLDEADRIARHTAARDAFRAHLALATTQPAFAQPQFCALSQTDKISSYQAFVDHLLYSAELMLETETGWEAVFAEQLEPHVDYLCSTYAPTGDTAALTRLLTSFRAENCQVASLCGN